MIDRNRMVFFNTAYMREYKGQWQIDRPINGGSFISQNGWGGEVFNFQPYKGTMYGYVEPGVVVAGGSQRRKINISRLGRAPGIKNLPYVSGVLVIWVARPPRSDESVMVGWYENATVYRESQKFLADPGRILPYGSYEHFAVAKESDYRLLPEGRRTLNIPRGAGAFGRSNIWYADSPLGKEIKNRVINFIDKWKRIDLSQ
jgi:hypothetical protein